jgi:membrane protein
VRPVTEDEGRPGFGASGVFSKLQSALNTIWGVTSKPGRGLCGIVRDRFFSFAMVLAVAFLLMVSLIVSAALAAGEKFFSPYLPGIPVLWQVANLAVGLLVATLLFALLYKVVPEAKIAWKDVWLGGAATALLFSLGKFFFGLYIGRSNVTSSYGAAGSLVALVIWAYGTVNATSWTTTAAYPVALGYTYQADSFQCVHDGLRAAVGADKGLVTLKCR